MAARICPCTAGLLFFLAAHAVALDAFRPWVRVGSSTPPSATHALLGGTEALPSFFALHFDQSPLLVRDSARTDRAGWTRTHRRWVRNEDVDALLAANASATSRGALQLNVDVVLTRGAGGRTERVARHWAGPSTSVDDAHVRAAFRDGFAVTVHRMERRSAAVAAFAQNLRAFWRVRVVAELRFAPAARDGRGAPETAGCDIYFVQLDGAQEIEVDPLDGDARVHTLEEGDVLYVPRGARVRYVPLAHRISLALAFRVDAASVTLAHGVQAALNAAQVPHLDERLRGEAGPTWRTLLRTSAAIAARVAPAMRTAMPLAPGPAEAIQEATGWSAEERLRAEIERFATAAERGRLLYAVAATLADGAGKDKGLVNWARELVARTRGDGAEFDKIERMFALCLRELRANTRAHAAAIQNLLQGIMSRARMRRGRVVQAEMEALRRHGQQFKTDPDSGGGRATFRGVCTARETRGESKTCRATRGMWVIGTRSIGSGEESRSAGSGLH